MVDLEPLFWFGVVIFGMLIGAVIGWIGSMLGFWWAFPVATIGGGFVASVWYKLVNRR